MIKPLFLAFLVAFMIAAQPSRKKGWTMAFRSDWNQSCLQVWLDSNPKADKLKVRNWCDCVSDMLQDHYTEKEMVVVELNPTAEYRQFAEQAAMSCISGPN